MRLQCGYFSSVHCTFRCCCCCCCCCANVVQGRMVPAIDMYAFGVILWELLGKPSFSDDALHDFGGRRSTRTKHRTVGKKPRGSSTEAALVSPLASRSWSTPSVRRSIPSPNNKRPTYATTTAYSSLPSHTMRLGSTGTETAAPNGVQLSEDAIQLQQQRQDSHDDEVAVSRTDERVMELSLLRQVSWPRRCVWVCLS